MGVALARLQVLYLAEMGVNAVMFQANLATFTHAGTAPGWLREGSDYTWVSWSGAPGASALASSLAWPGDVVTYVNPANALDSALDPGDDMMAVPVGTADAEVRSRAEALEGSTFIVPLYDQVTGPWLRTSGFARVSLERQDVPNGRLKLHYEGPCDRGGAPL